MLFFFHFTLTKTCQVGLLLACCGSITSIYAATVDKAPPRNVLGVKQTVTSKVNPENIANIDLKDTDVASIMRLLAEASRQNIVVTNAAAKTRINLYLTNVPIEEAVESVCKVAGLWYRRDSRSQVFRIMTLDEYRQDLQVFDDYENQVFTLNHTNAKAIAATIASLFGDRIVLSFGLPIERITLKASAGSPDSQNSTTTENNNATQNNNTSADSSNTSVPLTSTARLETRPEQLSPNLLEALSARSTSQGQGVDSINSSQIKPLLGQRLPIYLSVNQEHGQLIVRSADRGAMREISQLINKLDIAVPQVLLEMQILSAEVGDDFRSIVQLSGADNKGRMTARSLTQQVTGLPPTFTFQFLDQHILANLEALQENRRLKVLSTPVLLASNHRPARVFIGEERVLVRGATLETRTVVNAPSRDIIKLDTQIRELGTILNVLPKINHDGTISLALRQEDSKVSDQSRNILLPEPNGSGTISIAMDTVQNTTLESTIVLKDGLGVAVGGLFRTRNFKREQKVPLLGDIPLLGHLFRQQVDEKSNTELILIITPHIIRNDADMADSQHLSQRLSPLMSKP